MVQHPNMSFRAALGVVATGAVLGQPLIKCSWSPPGNPGITFDLTQMYSSTLDYNWRDPTDFETTNSTYTFNVCANVNFPPSSCANQASPAYQVTNNGGGSVCYDLGIDLNKLGVTKATWALIDPNDPSAGVALTYRSSLSSSGCPPGVSRSFTLEMGCAKGPVPQPGETTQFAMVDETDICNYRAHSWSVAGCPLQCPVVNGLLCAGNGVCRTDASINATRCFCYDNWTEKDCQAPNNPYPSGAIAGAVIGGIITGALATLGGVWGYSWNRQRGGASALPDVDGFYAPVKV